MTRRVLTSWKNAFIRFWHAPVSPQPLGLFRITISAFVLVQILFWLPDLHAFFGREAWVQWEISVALNVLRHIHLQDVHHALSSVFGLSEDQSVWVFFGVYALCATGLLIGWHTRVWAILTWGCHLIVMSTISTFVYGVDIFLHIALFYLMLMPVNKAYSLDLKAGRATGLPTWGVTLSLRVLQVHLCLAYLSAGYEKVLVADWWYGDVLWRSLVQPDFRQFDLTWLAKVPWLAMLLSWFTMIIETGYCIGMWIPRVRVFWLAGIIALHTGIAIFLGLWLFGLIMILLSLSAFGYDAYQDIQKFRQSRQAV